MKVKVNDYNEIVISKKRKDKGTIRLVIDIYDRTIEVETLNKKGEALTSVMYLESDPDFKPKKILKKFNSIK